MQRSYSLTSQYFKDVVRKLLFDDYSKSFNYWGDAERMYEECCVGFRSKDLFLPEKIEFEFYTKNFFIKILCVRWLSQCLRLDSGYSIGFPVVVDGSTDSCIPTDLVEAKEII